MKIEDAKTVSELAFMKSFTLKNAYNTVTELQPVYVCGWKRPFL